MIVFFLNRFNDIDHLAPVIYKIAEEANYRILIISIHIFIDVESDFRINHIKNKFPNLVVTSFLLSVTSPNLSKILHLIFSNSNKTKNKNFLRKIMRRILYKFSIIKLFERIFYTEARINRFLKNIDPFLVVVDHATTKRLPGMNVIFEYSKKNNIPTLSLPHGVSLFVKHDDDFNIAKNDMANTTVDHIVFTGKGWRDECIKAGLNKSKTHILGSARFCIEWKKILDSIMLWDISQRVGDNRLKVVFMDRGKKIMNDKYMSIQEGIDAISKLDFVDFKYKPQTRSNKTHFLTSNIEVLIDYNSVDIIKWADVVIGNYSSILIEALIQNKVVISPMNHKNQETLLEAFDACVKVNSNEEIIRVLLNIYSKGAGEYKRPIGRNNFLDNVVHANDNVLGEYSKLISSIVGNK